VQLPTAVRRIATALTYRDFRVIWSGAFLSSIGTWMQKIAQSWLVWTLTGSPFYLGLDAFLGELPILLFTLIGGVVADRLDRRRILLVSQCVQMASALTLAALVYSQAVHIWHILALSFMTGSAQAFGGPAYQSLLPSLVRRDDVPNAIALNSIQFNLARMLGPPLAGVALAELGSAACFGLNALSFLFVIVALLSMRIVFVAPVERKAMLTEMRGGLSYVRREPALMILTGLAFGGAMLGSPVMTLMPVFAQQVFHAGVGGYARMMTCSGAGAVLGALTVAWLGRFPRMDRVALGVQITLGVLLVAFASSRVLWLSYVLIFLTSIVLMMGFSLLMSLVQLAAPNELRGRVVSIYMMAFRGGMPLGSLAAGYVANLTSAPLTLTITGALLTLLVVGVAAKGDALKALADA
jgi:MFS family permease